ncbi:CPBP family intramembrane glutamic endopeptidase [Clostridium ganghwense]|uniref:CPBP family intramembrane metalloprotease n=1 Tax=Clostridium ganghwense TaxID=312089 RepID=A0ABT4CUL1_9CLOT|nr:CPBP family intramembrane glutamic endopeptidase [Clostridium ganghwense]MCY6372744.1 CPBP family intramembrane metalloprotease [Clostridium ganghwense]
MNFLKSIESGKISINKIGIFKAILIIIISFFIGETGLFFNGWIKSLGSAAPYGRFIVEIIFKFLSVVVILKIFSKKSEEDFEYNSPNLQYYLFTFLIIVGFRLFYEYSIGGIVSNIKMNPVIQKAFEELAVSPIVLILTVAVLAPIFEEVIFRGIILNGMAKRLNTKIAIIISAFLFALVHMNLVQGINAFLLGILLGFIYLKTRSIYLSIFAHFINNSVGIMIAGAMEKLAFRNELIFQIIVTIVGAIIMICGCLWYRKNGKNVLRELKCTNN